jgi:hypothetical protein
VSSLTACITARFLAENSDRVQARAGPIGVDAGLAEGLAAVTGRRAAFVSGVVDISQAVIPKLETSLTSAFVTQVPCVPGPGTVELAAAGELALFARAQLEGIESVLLSGEDTAGNRDELAIRSHKHKIMQPEGLNGIYGVCLHRVTLPRRSRL